MNNVTYIDVGDLSFKETCFCLDSIKGNIAGTTFKEINSITRPIQIGFLLLAIGQFAILISLLIK